MEMTKIELIEKIKELKVLIKKTEDFDERLELEKKRADLINELYYLIKEEREKSPTITAKELLAKRPPILEFYKTGIKTIDENLNGLVKGGFIQVAAASGAGKTTIMTKILSNIAKTYKVAHFDFELGEFKLNPILRKFLKTKEQLNNYFVNMQSYKLDDLIREITFLAEQDIKVILIDSKMKIETGERDMYKSASLISHELSKLTRSGDISIILINQMSDSAIREGRAELKGSGDQVYDSDVILVLTRLEDKTIQKEKGEPPVYDKTKRGIICVKNRFGETSKGEIYKSEIFEDEETKETKAVEIEPDISPTSKDDLTLKKIQEKIKNEDFDDLFADLPEI